MNDEKLTPREQRAFDGLPREEAPSDLLEERTVQALRSRGLLGSRRSRGLRLSPTRLALAASLVCAMMLGAFALGQSQGSRQTAEAMIAMHQQDSRQTALAVQQTGAAYLTALSNLVAEAGGQSPGQQAAGREAALRALYRVADQMVTLAPDDPLASRILQAFQQVETGPDQVDPAGESTTEQQVLWF